LRHGRRPTKRRDTRLAGVNRAAETSVNRRSRWPSSQQQSA
jgi:hypothetical protein